MSEPLPVFHIGANKAGSTTLQKALFARHREIANLGKPSFTREARQAFKHLRKACDRLQSGAVPLDPDLLRRLWTRATSSAGMRVPVVSHEELIRYHFYGAPDPERLPRAVHDMAGPVRVVIVTRHQLRLIESLYVHKSNISTYQPMAEWLSAQPEWFAYGYRFHEIAEAWAKVMGEQNVGVFAFEQLAADPASFAKNLCEFMGIDPHMGIELLGNARENVRKSNRTQTYVRLRAALLPGLSLGKFVPPNLREVWRGFLAGGNPSRAQLPPEWLHRIEEHYRRDNRQLAERFNLPLRQYGYPM